MNFFKNKTVLILVVVLILIVGGGAYFILGRNSGTEQPTQEEEQQVKEISASDIGLSLKPRADNRAVIMTINKLSGISTIEYEVNYNAENTDPEAGGEGDVPRGVVASPIQVKSGESSVTREILLGTCSANVCKYDKVTSDITVVLKVTYTNGEIGTVTEKISLE